MPPATYIDITSYPLIRPVTPTELNTGAFGGVPLEVWFRRVVTTKEAFGSFATSNPTGFDFVPATTVYAADATTVLHTIPASGSSGKSWYFIFNPGTYWIKVRNNYSTPIANNFTVTFDDTPILTSITPGSLIINDDTSGFPATVITNGLFAGVYEAIPPGETGASLPTGESLWHDKFGKYDAVKRLALFDSNAAYVMSLNTINGLSGNEPLICANQTDFWVYDPGDRTVNKIAKTGVVTRESGTLAIGVKSALGVNNAGTIAYYAKGRFDGIIYKYDLITDTLLANLYAISGWSAPNDWLAMTLNFNPGELLVLSDDSIVTWWHDDSASTSHVLHLSSLGTLLHDFSYLEATYGKIDHISYGLIDRVNTITIWFQSAATDTGYFYTLSLLDGSLVSYNVSDMFSAGIDIKDNSPNIFGPSESCAMITYLSAPTPPPPIIVNPGSGIYKLVPGKHNDTYYNDDLTATVTSKIP